MISWNPSEYLKYGDERTRPAVELAARVHLDAPARVIDLGCGPGNSTQVLRRRWPAARISGLDHSKEMIGSALRNYPDQEWILGDIAAWSAASPFDIVFSNAALQWLPDHAGLIRRLFSQVAPGGALAIQIPSGAHSPVRAIIREVSMDAAWSARMEEARRALTMEPPHVYYEALAPQAKAVDLWETEYHHVMDSPEAIVAWISSTSLRPYLGALRSDEEKRSFLDRLAGRIAEAYPRRADGRVLFPFRRMFVVAHRSGT